MNTTEEALNMSEQEPSTSDPWADAEIISIYSRAQTLEDGFLVDVSQMAREAGFRFPVAVTEGVWAVLNPSKELEAEGQDVEGRMWDMFTILRHAIRRASRTDEIHFAPLFIRKPGQRPQPVAMKAICSPGDSTEPVITILLPNED